MLSTAAKIPTSQLFAAVSPEFSANPRVYHGRVWMAGVRIQLDEPLAWQNRDKLLLLPLLQ
ncbi:MAG: hypothetical protein AAGG48_08320 [Planctomycetota bacterium]